MNDQIVLDKGGKRKLPQWMFATTTAVQVKEKVKTDHVDNNDNDNTEGEIVTQKCNRLKNTKIEDIKEATTEDSSTKLLRCQTTKRSRRKSSLPNDDCNDESGLRGRKYDRIKVNGDGAIPMLTRQKKKTKNSKIEGGTEIEESTITSSGRGGLRKRKHSRMKENSDEAGPSLSRKKQKVKNSRKGDCKDVEESTPKTDDEDLTVEDLMRIAEEYAGDADEDLTVEDLMSIAKEYVNENEKAASCKERSVPMEDATSVSIGSLGCIEVYNQPLRREETNSGCISSKERKIEDAPPKIKMSDNPTQDMLDVFLGPLLKRTYDEKSIDLVREDMNLAHDLNKKNQSVLSGLRPVFVKKKSSLKDKHVALSLRMLKIEKERAQEVRRATAAIAQFKAEYKEWVAVLQTELAKSQAELKDVVASAEAKIKTFTEDLNVGHLHKDAEVEKLNDELASAKAQLLEDANKHHEKSKEYLVAINKLELQAGRIPGLETEVARLRDKMTESSRRAKVKASKLKLENAWAVVKTRLKALKECKDGAIDLDAEIAKAEANAAKAQKIIDDLSSREGSDKDDAEERDDESVKGGDDNAEGDGDDGENSAYEDDDNAEKRNP